MSRQRLLLDTANQDLYLFNFGKIVRKRVYNRIDGSHFVEHSTQMASDNRIREINERCALLRNKEILHLGLFRQRRQHRIQLWAFLKFLKNLSRAVGNLD